jgi:hypothetical protein
MITYVLTHVILTYVLFSNRLLFLGISILSNTDPPVNEGDTPTAPLDPPPSDPSLLLDPPGLPSPSDETRALNVWVPPSAAKTPPPSDPPGLPASADETRVLIVWAPYLVAVSPNKRKAQESPKTKEAKKAPVMAKEAATVLAAKNRALTVCVPDIAATSPNKRKAEESPKSKKEAKKTTVMAKEATFLAAELIVCLPDAFIMRKVPNEAKGTTLRAKQKAIVPVKKKVNLVVLVVVLCWSWVRVGICHCNLG